DALSCGQSIGFDDDRILRSLDRAIRLSRRGALDETGGRNIVRREELFREGFTRFQTRLLGRGSDYSKTVIAKHVHKTLAQRKFRPDKCQIDTPAQRKIQEACDIRSLDRNKLRLFRNPAVPRRREDLQGFRTLRERVDNRALPASGADDQYLHFERVVIWVSASLRAPVR